LKTCWQIKFTFLLSALLACVSIKSFAQLQFVENKGQWEKEVDFKSDISNGAFFLQPQGFTVLLQNQQDLEAISERVHGHAHGDEAAKTVAPAASTCLQGSFFRRFWFGESLSRQSFAHVQQLFFRKRSIQMEG
jgi:hypothetical protein